MSKMIHAGTQLRCVDAGESEELLPNDRLFKLEVGRVYTVASDTNTCFVELLEARGISYIASRFEVLDKPRHKLVYLAGPYSQYENKEVLMTAIMGISGMYMMKNPGEHVVSPLFNHYSIHLTPGMEGDYNFWGDYSINLLKRCDKVIVVMLPGWDQSTGVKDEIEKATASGIEIVYVDPVEFNFNTAVFETYLK
jgi:hypothetical protein